MRDEFNARPEWNFWIGCDSAPINLFSTCKTAIVVFFDVNTNRAITISGNQIKMPSPKSVIKAIKSEGKKSVRKNEPLKTRGKGS